MDERVSAFSYCDKRIFYGKKEYKGAWCEWKMLVMDIEEQKVRSLKESSVLDIGEIVLGNDELIYYMESGSYKENYDRTLYRIDNLWGRKKICGLEKGERVLGVY